MDGDLITEDFQAEFRGVLFGTDTLVVDADGPQGLLTLADRRSSTKDRPQSDGRISTGPDWLSGLTVSFPITVLGDTVSEALGLRDTVAGAFTPSPSGEPEPLVMQLAGTKYRWLVKPTRFSAPVEHVPHATIPCVGEYEILDPVRYTNTESTVSSGLASTSGGLTFPHGYPFTYGTVDSGSVTAQNDGTAQARLSAKITAGAGGLTGPRLTHVESGKVLAFDDLTLNAGEWIDLDWWDQTVLLNGVASRAAMLVRPLSEWFRLAPGLNTILFGGTGVGTLDVSWRSAWA